MEKAFDLSKSHDGIMLGRLIQNNPFTLKKVDKLFYNETNNYVVSEKTIKDIECKFKDKQVVTLVWKFKKFYPEEDYQQDYYQNNFLRYLAYKSGC